MKRLTWDEMRQHWANHDAEHGAIDFKKDPEGLQNVCIPTAPGWLNEYHARIQRIVYEKLLGDSMLGGPALDIGCGTGRWCGLLYECGYTPIGIDLQKSVIETNRKRYPAIVFINGSIQEFLSLSGLTLISSVTVLQHNPFDEQEKIVRHLNYLLNPGGRAIVLENVSYQGPTVFSRSQSEWIDLFEANGFVCLKTIRYDHSLFMAAFEATIGTGQRWRRLREKAFLLCGLLDEWIEPIFIYLNLSFFKARHCGFLFERR